MRGRFQDQGGLFSYIRPEERIPAVHPLREIRKLVREVLKELSHSFGKLYSHEGRPSIPPEQLLSALLLQVFYGLRSERQLMEQLNYNLLFRWFVGLSPDDPVWDATTFTKNRDRLQRGDVLRKFMERLLDRQGSSPYCRTSISRSTARSSRPGPRTRASSPKTARMTAMARTFTARGVKTTRIKAQATRRPSSIAKRPGAKPSSAICAMRSWRTATVLLLTAPSHRPAASPSGVPLRRCSRRKPNDRDEESRSARTRPTIPAITLRRCAR